MDNPALIIIVCCVVAYLCWQTAWWLYWRPRRIRRDYVIRRLRRIGK